MSSVISGNNPDECIHLFNVLSRKQGLVVCFDGSVGKIQIYQKEGARFKVLKRQNRLFSIFDPDIDGRDPRQNAKRWVECAEILSRQLKDRGIEIRILPNDQCVFTRVLERSFVPFSDVVDLVRDGRITVAYGAEQLGMPIEAFREALEQAGVHIAEE